MGVDYVIRVFVQILIALLPLPERLRGSPDAAPESHDQGHRKNSGRDKDRKRVPEKRGDRQGGACEVLSGPSHEHLGTLRLGQRAQPLLDNREKKGLLLEYTEVLGQGV